MFVVVVILDKIVPHHTHTQTHPTQEDTHKNIKTNNFQKKSLRLSKEKNYFFVIDFLFSNFSV